MIQKGKKCHFNAWELGSCKVNIGELFMSYKYTSIDLFSGPGGLCTGLKEVGIKPLIAVEMSSNTVQTYSQTHDADILVLKDWLANKENTSHLFQRSERTIIIEGDITKVSNELITSLLQSRYGVSKVDVVTGGAPCESFSFAGTRREEDERNNLFLNLERVAKHVDAKILLFENVKGLFSKPYEGIKGGMYHLICDELENKNSEGIAFNLTSRKKEDVLLNAKNYGTPQSRERIILVGVNTKYKNTFTYPLKTHGPGCIHPYVTVQDAFMWLPSVGVREEEENLELDISKLFGQQKLPEHLRLYLEFMCGNRFRKPSHLDNYITSHKGPGHREKVMERFTHIKPGEGTRKAGLRLIAAGQEELVKKLFPKALYNASHRRLKLNEPSHTVTGHCLDEMLHPILNRSITVREAARLQSFPDWYRFIGPYVNFHGHKEQNRYEQVGDAIPPLLGYALGEEIVKTLDTLEENATNELNLLENRK